MNTLRILHVIDQLNIISGLNSVVMNYYNHIDKSRVIFDFMVHKEVPDQTVRYLEQNGSKIFVMPGLKLKNLAHYMKELLNFFREHSEYRIIHGHLPNAALFYLGIAKLKHVPIRIIHSHNSKSADSKIKKLRNDILNSSIPLVANNFIACSDLAAAFLFGNKARDAFLLFNAIDTDLFFFSRDIRKRIRNELGLTDDQILIGNVGRFCNQKNQLFLIHIFNEINRILPDSRLMLIGEGDLYDEIRKSAEELNLIDKVIFLGVTQRVNEYLQAMDAFVLPSLFEGLPVSAVEAQTAGLPCFMADTISPQTVFSKNAYFLSLDSHPKDWANKICSLTKPEEREGVYDPRFDIKVQAKQLEQYYLNLVSTGGI